MIEFGWEANLKLYFGKCLSKGCTNDSTFKQNFAKWDDHIFETNKTTCNNKSYWFIYIN